MHTVDPQQFREPFVVTELEDHPVYRQHPKPELKEYLFPDWYHQGEMMIVVPVCRVESICGAMMIKFDDDTVRLKEADTKFLSITSSQLAITLENLSLLEETQKAYSRLKELQDETIELEKMATRGQISAEIGHELNNFLGVVAGNLSLLEVNLKRGNLDQLDRHVTAMTDTITKMKSFTANLMDLTPISSTKELLYFDKIIREVVEYLKPQKRYRDIAIKIDRLASDVPFEADGTQIQQLLYNLFNNAADATKGSDHREIIVSVNKPSDGSTFTVTIKDTGEGIEPALLEKAFKEKFTTKKSGHGFGLIVCNRIIENHGGQLRIDSTPGQGTAISIDFPLRAPELVPA
jgi:signal transduction histidine kinase